jgi:hypothetical protein
VQSHELTDGNNRRRLPTGYFALKQPQQETPARQPQGWAFLEHRAGFGPLAGNCRARDFLAAYSLYDEEQSVPRTIESTWGSALGSIMSKSLYSAEHWRMRAQQIMAMADKARS